MTANLVKQLGQKVAAIEGTLQQALSTLQNTSVGDFSGDGAVLSNVYPGAVSFAQNDMTTKISQLKQMSDGLVQTAATWEQAEQASTVQSQG
jgi:phage-related protein